ncbi:MAG: efflux transporter outer membrane subunit [Kiritimatiellaeota bacterium]|nr:efflux transporter outer membrane subunit [Kiritimatiellota bacterium]
MRRAVPALAVCALFLAGCMVGPDYRRCGVDVPASFRGGPAERPSASLADVAWWDLFQDETLNQLIRAALTNNYDLRIAIARVEQARAVETQVRSGLFPAAGYQGDATRGKNALQGKAAVNEGQTVSAFLGTLNVAWELDLWGRLRRLDEAAQAQWLASVEARRGVELSLVAAVAQAYFELLELDALRENAERTAQSFRESLQIFGERLAGGVASKLETTRAEAALATTLALLPELERQIALKENEIAILLGRNPASLPRTATLLQQRLAPDIPAGLPSALLERRPDLRAAEQQLRAANAQVGAALGDFLPRIGLTALFGAASAELSSLNSGKSGVLAVDANLTGPLFQSHRLTGQYRQTQAARVEAELRYRQTALNAFREVADALVSRQRFENIREQQARAGAAYAEAVKVSLERYRAGRASYYEVLEAQQQLFPAENALTATRLNQLLVIVQLYKALGGGWQTGFQPPASH